MNSIIVVQNCLVSYPGLPDRAFTAAEVVQPYSPYYKPLLWSGLATDSGVPGVPDGPDVQPMETIYVQRPTVNDVSVKWNNATKKWVVYAVGGGGGGGGTGDAASTSFMPTGGISASNVQDAVAEVDAEKLTSFQIFTSKLLVALTRTTLNFTVGTDSANLDEVVINGKLMCWRNEWGALRGTAPYSWGDALVRGLRETSDGIGPNGQYIELADRRAGAAAAPGHILHGRKWSDGTLVRNGVLMADSYVRVGGSTIPPLLPPGTVVIEIP